MTPGCRHRSGLAPYYATVEDEALQAYAKHSAFFLGGDHSVTIRSTSLWALYKGRKIGVIILIPIRHL